MCSLCVHYPSMPEEGVESVVQVVQAPIWMLGIELGSSAKVVDALNC